MTQLSEARKNKITEQMKIVAREEGVSPEFIRYNLALGKIVIPWNRMGKGKGSRKRPVGIGKGLRTKVNANIGTSPEEANINTEKKKLNVAISVGADTVMDLSTGGRINDIRKMVLNESKVPVGTVPIYEVMCDPKDRGKDIADMEPEDLFGNIEKQAKQGVDFMTVHCGVTLKTLDIMKEAKRVAGIVSRGGSFLAHWMLANKKENPLYLYFNRLLDIAHKYDVTLSLGDGLRPGSIADATDSLQIAELSVLGHLTELAWKRNVQVMIEGPGHVPLDQIEANVVLEKELCREAPFYVLGPLVTDISPGYDHITSAIGGALAASFGADFLCYVTPSEHIRLPRVEDVRMGVIASRIAAHAADITKGIGRSRDWDIKMSRARRNLDWKKQKMFSIDPKKFEEERNISKPRDKRVCTMCGRFCAIKTLERLK